MKFVLDENHNRHEALDKEGVEALLAEAIRTGQLPSVDEDTAFVTMLKDPITGQSHKIVMCTQAQFNAMLQGGTLISNAYYYITDDTTAEDLEDHLVQNDARVSSLEEVASKTMIHDLGKLNSLEDLMTSARAYWRDGGTSYECKGKDLVYTYYFKHISTNTLGYFIAFQGDKSGLGTYHNGAWTIEYFATEAESIAQDTALTKTGLYAVRWETSPSGLRDYFVTQMLSIENLAKNVKSSTYFDTINNLTLYAFYDASTQKVSIKTTGGSTFGAVINLTLIAKY